MMSEHPFSIVLAGKERRSSFERELCEQCPDAKIWHIGFLTDNSVAAGAQPVQNASLSNWHADAIVEADVLVIELEMPARVGGDWDHREILSEFGGARFICTQYEKLGCQCVVLVTLWSEETREWVDHLTRRTDHVPPVRKFEKFKDDVRLIEMISARYRAYERGFVDQTDIWAIELAAAHSDPVMIVGESGTGKEFIAHEIHTLWAAQQARIHNIKAESLGIRVINCAGLAAELARAELFGCVKGSFTGADDHRLGECLIAAGLTPLATRRAPTGKPSGALKRIRDDLDRIEHACQSNNLAGGVDLLKRLLQSMADTKRPSLLMDIERVMSSIEERAYVDSQAEYRKLLLEQNNDLVQADADSMDITVSSDRPCGTLFLDEFGDLDKSVQALLLRYLDKHEVKPLGYPGVINKAQVRIIAATSDPEIARMVGRPISSRPRKREAGPFREDLVFRMKSQVIRATPVAPAPRKRIASCLDRLIAENSELQWDEEARDYVIDQVIRVTERIERSLRRGVPPPYVFGHRRELRNLIRLADSFVKSATIRGEAGWEDTVTRSAIERLWKPSAVSSEDDPDCPLTSDAFPGLPDSLSPDIETAREGVSYIAERLAGTTDSELVLPGKLIKQNESLAAAVLLTLFCLFKTASNVHASDITKRILRSTSQDEAHKTAISAWSHILSRHTDARGQTADERRELAQQWSRWCDAQGIELPSYES